MQNKKQKNWSERFDEKFRCICNQEGKLHYAFDMYGKELKSFIREEVKMAKREVLEEVKNKAEQVSKDYCLVEVGLDDCSSCYPLQKLLEELGEK